MVTALPWTLYPKKDLVPLVQEARWTAGRGWTGTENLPPSRSDPWTIQPVASHWSFLFAIYFSRIPRITERLCFVKFGRGYCRLLCWPTVTYNVIENVLERYEMWNFGKGSCLDISQKMYKICQLQGICKVVVFGITGRG